MRGSRLASANLTHGSAGRVSDITSNSPGSRYSTQARRRGRCIVRDYKMPERAGPEYNGCISRFRKVHSVDRTRDAELSAHSVGSYYRLGLLSRNRDDAQ